jgi:hypothetical protein
MGFQTGGTGRLATEKPFNNLLRTLRDQDYALILRLDAGVVSCQQ